MPAPEGGAVWVLCCGLSPTGPSHKPKAARSRLARRGFPVKRTDVYYGVVYTRAGLGFRVSKR